MIERSVPSLLVAWGLCVVGSAPRSAPQAVSRNYFEDTQNGYKLKAPKDWEPVPVKPEEQAYGIAARFEGESISTNINSQAASYDPNLYVFVSEGTWSRPTTGGGAKKEKEEEGRARPDVIEIFDELFPGRRLKDKEPFEEETKTIKKVKARHRAWDMISQTNLGRLEVVADVWTFDLGDRDVNLIFEMPRQHYGDWEKAFYSVAKTFKEIEREERLTVSDGSSYSDLLAFHEEEASRTPGWRVVPTPSRRFIIKTSSDNDKFLEVVIERLENSRDLFERDFPPKKEIEHVSVVRVCASEDEFMSYGNTPRGVVGWFNPETTELVLFDASDVDRRSSYAVMTHEAFHQYCHFLFDEVKAHRWFDEGHGDYYGAFEFTTRGPKAETRMPAGLDRLPLVRQMLREESWMPMLEHVNADRSKWYARSVYSYAQSWSIVYMLRQGMLGEVNRSCWKAEYEDIIPTYMTTLHEGFQEARERLLDLAKAEAQAAGETLPEGFRPEIPPEEIEQIHAAAIQASWGPIDMDAFTEDWKLFCDKYL